MAEITNENEYQGALRELEYLEKFLKDVEERHPHPEHGLVKAGIRKKIAHIHEELGCYEADAELKAAQAKPKAKGERAEAPAEAAVASG